MTMRMSTTRPAMPKTAPARGLLARKVLTPELEGAREAEGVERELVVVGRSSVGVSMGVKSGGVVLVLADLVLVLVLPGRDEDLLDESLVVRDWLGNRACLAHDNVTID
jgi:hypothetical protein